jgi:DNA-binding transcriptional MerR regulator
MSKRQQIEEMLDSGMSVKEISGIFGGNPSYIYHVKNLMNADYVPKQRSKSKTACNYEGPEGLKLLLDEYDNACKTIDKVMDFLLKENSDLKEQVRQFSRITREANRPTWSPAVRNALVVHGD